MVFGQGDGESDASETPCHEVNFPYLKWYGTG